MPEAVQSPEPLAATPRSRLLGLRPKHVYRELDRLFGSPEERDGLVEAFLAELYARFRDELALASIRVYAETGGRFRLVEDLGEGGGSGPASVDAGEPLIEALRQRWFVIVEEPDALGIEPPPAGQAAALLIDGAAPRRLLLLFLDERRAPERLEFVLGAMHSALTARLLQERLGRSLREAGEIQRSLLPAAAPSLPGFELAGASTPAEEVGGDFFDYLPLDAESLAVAVGDASGHGLPAALLVRDVVVGLRMGMAKDVRAGHVLARLNRVIHASALSSSFVSLVHVELECSGVIEFWNAGHEPPLLFDAAGTHALRSRDPVLGPLHEPSFRRRFAHLDRGATLVLYTDGIIERRDAHGEVFGAERLAQSVRASLDLPAARILERIFAAAEAFGGATRWEDDATVVVVRRLP